MTPAETGDAPVAKDIGRDGSRRDLGDLIRADEGDVALPEAPPQPAPGLIERAGERLTEHDPGTRRNGGTGERPKGTDIERAVGGGKV